VIAQIAFSVILLTGAFVFVKNLAYVLRFDPGFDFAHTIWLSMPKPQAGPDASPQQIRDKLYHELESQPGVEAVSWAWYLPFNFAYGEPTLHRADSGETFRVTEQGIGPGYLQTMRLPLLSGREFNWNDLNTSTDVPQPVIINEAFARAHFTDRSPVGDRLIGGRNGATKTMVIIGVSANTSFRSPGEKPIPLLQSLSRLTSNFIVRVARPSSVAAPEIAKAMEPSVPGGVTYFTMHERVDRALWPSRASTALLGAFAAIGLVLSLIGLSGISIYNTTRRTSEIGVRMAFGATTGNVMGLMIRESLSLVAIGTGVGIALALALTRLLNGFLAGSINSWDPGAYLAMLVTIFLTAVVSVWFPSRRATRVDPSISLRSE
jgi:putative ABC transport system permease protein